MKSISNALLTRVLSIYLALTTLLFGLDVAIEYVETKADIVSELETLHDTFGGNVAYSMWHMFDDQLDVTLAGVLNIPSVTRVLVLTPNGDLVRDFKTTSPDKQNDLLPNQLFSSLRPIKSGTQQLGWLEIQSNSGVILNKMKTRLLVNAIAALVKTAVLVLLVKLFFDQVLSRPLFRIANQAAKLDPHAIEQQPLAVDQGHNSARRFNVAKYIEDVLLTHHAELRKAGANALLECDPELEIDSNPGAWSQILSNLIANSVTHGFAGRGSGNEIVIHVSHAGDQLILDYRENGKGMNDDTAKHIFDPFFTTNRHNGGSGLGMHVVFNLVTQQLGGNIELDTGPGRGTAFKITLPIAPTHDLPT